MTLITTKGTDIKEKLCRCSKTKICMKNSVGCHGTYRHAVLKRETRWDKMSTGWWFHPSLSVQKVVSVTTFQTLMLLLVLYTTVPLWWWVPPRHAIPSKELVMNNRNGCHLVCYVVIALFVFCFQRRSVVHWCPKEDYSIAFQMLVIGWYFGWN